MHIKLVTREYYVRRVDRRTFEVSKFLNGDDAPTTVYTVRERTTPHPIHKYACNCAAGHFHRHVACKHQAMVDNFKQEGEPIPFLADESIL